ncbi:MAG: ABC transporter permease [Planctomycetes bacterium]|nr:ABC transporter permease [Planctomycetota bacterium]
MTPRIIAANLVVRLRSFSREKSAMFFTVAFPVILVLVFGAIFTKPEHMNFELPVQDLDQSDASAKLVKGLASQGVFETIPVPADADAIQYTRDHKINLLLIIPKGFEDMQLRRLEEWDDDASVTLTYIYDPSSTSLKTKLQFLNAMAAAANQEISGTSPFITLKEQSILAKKYRFIEFFVPGIIAMAVMTSSLSGALNTNAELRQKGILRKLATTPITRTDWLLSNVLYQIVLAVISTVSILLVSYAVFDVRLEINAWLPVYVVLEVFAFVGIGMLLTPIAREAESAAAAGNAFLFPMMFLSGTFFPVEMMPGFLQKFARILPLYYLNEGLRASMIFVDNTTALRCAAITAAVAGVVFVAGALVTRWDQGA